MEHRTVISSQIPQSLSKRPQWVLWREIERDGKLTKMLFQLNGQASKSNDPSTWSPFDKVIAAYGRGNWDGPGFVFTAKDNFLGIDLDGCRNPDTGEIASWAQQVINQFNTYIEVSPSETGVKMFCIGENPLDCGKNKKLGYTPVVPGKKPGVEIYDRLRYFAVTGWRLEGKPAEPQECQKQINAFCAKFWPQKPAVDHRGNGQSKSSHQSSIIDRARKYLAKMPGAISGQAGHNTAFSTACVLVQGFDLSIDDAYPLFVEWNSTCEPPWSEAEIRHKLESAEKDPGERGKLLNAHKSNGLNYDGGHNSAREEVLSRVKELGICISAKSLPTLTEQAWNALQESNTPPILFRSGSILSRIEPDDDGAPMIRELGIDRMRHHLARATEWFKVTEKRGEKFNVPAIPPKDVVRDMLATPDPPLPVLTRIVEAPVFAPDETLQTAPGYHPASRTYYAPHDGFEIPAVSEKPATTEVSEAVKLISEELIGDFPFVGESERAHAVAAFLLPYVRDMIRGSTPLHLIEAPSPGTGKTLLVDAIVYPSTGRSIASMTEGRDDDEWRKRIFAKLKGGANSVILDNIRKRLDCSALASAITAYPEWEDRILGKSEISRVSVRCLWIATGNNPAVSDEMARRIVRIRLDARIDRPWLRFGFHHPDLRAWMKENRGKLVWAGLTLIQSWIAANRPLAEKSIGMFEAWAQVIGGILQHAGISGFLDNINEFYDQSDADGAQWRAFVLMWWEKFGTNERTVAELWPVAKEDQLLDLGDKGDHSQKIRLGKMLSEARDRTFTLEINKEQKLLRLERGDETHRARLWKLTDTTNQKSECVSVGECIPGYPPACAPAHVGGDENTHTHSSHSLKEVPF